MKKLLLSGLVLISAACTNYYKYPPYAVNGNPFMIVVNPAGTNGEFGYNPVNNRFVEKSPDEEADEIKY